MKSKLVLSILIVALVMPMASPQPSQAAVLPEFFCGLAETFGWQSNALNWVCNVMQAINDSGEDPMGDPFYDPDDYDPDYGYD